MSCEGERETQNVGGRRKRIGAMKVALSQFRILRIPPNHVAATRLQFAYSGSFTTSKDGTMVHFMVADRLVRGN